MIENTEVSPDREEGSVLSVPQLPKGYRAVRIRDVILWLWAIIVTLLLLCFAGLVVLGWVAVKSLDLDFAPVVRPAVQVGCSEYWSYVQIAKENGATPAQVEQQYRELGENISWSAQAEPDGIEDLCGSVIEVWSFGIPETPEPE